VPPLARDLAVRSECRGPTRLRRRYLVSLCDRLGNLRSRVRRRWIHPPRRRLWVRGSLDFKSKPWRK